jgi:hypothetical protein
MEHFDKYEDSKQDRSKAVNLDRRPALLFSTSPWRLVIFSVLSLDLYGLYWRYKQWQAIKKAEQSNIYPFVRSFFLVFFLYSFFKKIEKSMLTSNNIIARLSPLGLTIGGVFIWLFSRAGGLVYSLVTDVIVLFIEARIQKDINANNAAIELSRKELDNEASV